MEPPAKRSREMKPKIVIADRDKTNVQDNDQLLIDDVLIMVYKNLPLMDLKNVATVNKMSRQWIKEYKSQVKVIKAEDVLNLASSAGIDLSSKLNITLVECRRFRKLFVGFFSNFKNLEEIQGSLQIDDLFLRQKLYLGDFFEKLADLIPNIRSLFDHKGELAYERNDEIIGPKISDYISDFVIAVISKFPDADPCCDQLVHGQFEHLSCKLHPGYLPGRTQSILGRRIDMSDKLFDNLHLDNLVLPNVLFFKAGYITIKDQNGQYVTDEKKKRMLRCCPNVVQVEFDELEEEVNTTSFIQALDFVDFPNSKIQSLRYRSYGNELYDISNMRAAIALLLSEDNCLEHIVFCNLVITTNKLALGESKYFIIEKITYYFDPIYIQISGQEIYENVERFRDEIKIMFKNLPRSVKRAPEDELHFRFHDWLASLVAEALN